MNRRTLLSIIIMMISMPIMAQYYAPTDTTYEYSLHGTRYADMFEGRKTASGEVFHQNLYTAAHWKMKFGTLVLVTCPETNKQLIVKINDRCPKKGVLDMTKRAATELGIKGCKKVIARQLPNSYQSQWEEQDGPINLNTEETENIGK